MTRQKRKVAITTALLLGGVVMGSVAKSLAPLSPAGFIALMAVTIALVGWGAMYCWTLLDEAQQEAHKWAWYWGGSTGLLLGLVAVTLVLRIEPQVIQLIRPNATPKTYVELGYSASALSTLIGYGVAWGAWWLKRR